MSTVVKFTLEAEVDGATRGVKELGEAIDETSRSANKAERATKKLADANVKTERSAKKAAAELKKLEDATGEADSVMQGLASALDLVSPSLGAFVRGAGDLSGGLEAVARTGTNLAPVLSVLSVAAGAVYLAWRNWNEEAERSERIGKLVMDQQRKLKPLLDATRDAVIDLRIANGELTDEQGAKLRAATSAWEVYKGVTEDARKRIAELKSEQSGLLTQLVDQVELVGDSNPKMWLLAQALDGVTTSSSEMQDEIDALQEVLTGAQSVLSETVDTQQELIETQQGLSKSSDTVTEGTQAMIGATLEADAALRAAIQRGEQYAAVLRRLSDAATGVAATELGLGQGGLQDVLTVLATSQDAGEVGAAADILASLAKEAEKQQAAVAATGEAFAEMEGTIAAVDGSMLGFGDAMAALESATEELTKKARRSTAASVGGDLLVGNAGGALAALGPLGAAGALLGRIGDQGGADGVIAALEETGQNIVDGIVALPELIVTRLPEFAVRLSLALAKAIVVELPEALRQAVLQALQDLKQFLKDLFSFNGSVREAISDFFTPSGSRATGGGIPVTGLYELHEGERVIPASGVTSATGRSSLARASRGGGPPIVIQAGVVTPSLEREVGEMVRRYLSPYGAGGTLEPVV